MRLPRFTMAVLALALAAGPTRTLGDPPGDLARLQAAFQDYSGAKLVFDAGDLPPGHYFDRLPSLPAAGQIEAARIAVAEAKKLPPNYLARVGFKTLGIFQACVSATGDGFRPYNHQWQGYVFYGVWNSRDGAAAAFYSSQQLPLTFHHEIFHHIDSTRQGVRDTGPLAKDERFRSAISGEKPYPPLALAPTELEALKRASKGAVLEGAVSDYARKTVGEDKAETARYLMSHLPDALVQAATRPELAGSQRILHVLAKYQQAAPDDGPGPAWFVGVALGQAAPQVAAARSVAPPAPTPKQEPPPDVVGDLSRLAEAAEVTEEQYTEALAKAEELSATALPAEQAQALTRASAALVQRVLRERVVGRDGANAFRIRGREDSQGVNLTLRADVRRSGEEAARLARIAAHTPDLAETVTRVQLRDLRLLARYYLFIESRWKVSEGTRQVFEAARNQFTAALPAPAAQGLKDQTGLEWSRLAWQIDVEGKVQAPAATREVPVTADVAPARVVEGTGGNPYLAKVDAAVSDRKVRETIRKVQPACVRLNGGRSGSGVCLTPEGHVLTAGHCVRGVGERVECRFPDGRTVTATCIALDTEHDLALLVAEKGDPLPAAPVAAEAPEVGSAVVCIGQPGSRTPGGQATGYQPFHVSAGVIHSIVGDPTGPQMLGRARHTAWTYWGHSGSPLFNELGALVALHNSWDSNTALRHAVTYQCIRLFLQQNRVPFTTVGE
jgi:hypothetical protein